MRAAGADAPLVVKTAFGTRWDVVENKNVADCMSSRVYDHGLHFERIECFCDGGFPRS